MMSSPTTVNVNVIHEEYDRSCNGTLACYCPWNVMELLIKVVHSKLKTNKTKKLSTGNFTETFSL